MHENLEISYEWWLRGYRATIFFALSSLSLSLHFICSSMSRAKYLKRLHIYERSIWKQRHIPTTYKAHRECDFGIKVFWLLVSTVKETKKCFSFDKNYLNLCECVRVWVCWLHMAKICWVNITFAAHIAGVRRPNLISIVRDFGHVVVVRN